MSDTKKPFTFLRVECPICKSLNEFEKVSTDAYIEGGRDTDFCPTGIEWKHPNYKSHNPLLYFTATCSNCFYTREFNESYINWKNDDEFKSNKLRTIKEKHLEHLTRVDSLLKELGIKIEITSFPNESAIIKLLLAIYEELLSNEPSSTDLGRWYLRIAWVFREMGRGENSGLSIFKGMLEEIENRFSQLWQRLEAAQEQNSVFARHINAHFESSKIPSEFKSQRQSFKEKFSGRVTALSSSIETIKSQLTEISRIIDNYKDTTLGIDGTGKIKTFGGHSSFSEFLEDLSKKWDGAVIDEQSAMKKAIVYYKKAFQENASTEANNQLIQESYLIAELSRRVGNVKQAKDYFHITIKHGQEYINRHREDISQTALARKILELAIEQNRTMNQELKKKVI